MAYFSYRSPYLTLELTVNSSTMWFVSKPRITAAISEALSGQNLYLNGAPVISVQVILKAEGKLSYYTDLS